MGAIGVSPEIAAQIAANLKVFRCELDVVSAGLELTVALSRLDRARAQAGEAKGAAMRRPEVLAIVAGFREPQARTDDMRAMLEDLAAACGGAEDVSGEIKSCR